MKHETFVIMMLAGRTGRDLSDAAYKVASSHPLPDCRVCPYARPREIRTAQSWSSDSRTKTVGGQ
jgi:hypothetical protein